MKDFLQKWGVEIAALTMIIVTIIALMMSCSTSDSLLAKKNINCEKINHYTAAICCMQFMSSKSGNDSKDAVCRPLIDELTTRLESERKKEMLLFCDSRSDKRLCLDIVSSRR